MLEGLILQGSSGGDVVPAQATGFGREVSVFPVWLLFSCNYCGNGFVLRLTAWEEKVVKIHCSKKNWCKLALLWFPLGCLEVKHQSCAIWSYRLIWHHVGDDVKSNLGESRKAALAQQKVIKIECPRDIVKGWANCASLKNSEYAQNSGSSCWSLTWKSMW